METAGEALVIAAHGSHRHPDSAIAALEHADRLRERHQFAEVRACFWKEEPAFREVLRTLESETVYVVPLFMSEGYFVDRILPRELRLTPGQELDVDLDVVVTPPVGTHPTLIDVVLNRAKQAINDSRCGPEVGLALVGHGTDRHEQSAASTWEHVDRLDQCGQFDAVSAFFLDESPFVSEIPSAFDTEDVVVVPLFVADGYHTTDDIPQELGFPGTGIPRGPIRVAGSRIWYTGAVGTDPRMADVICERATEAGASDGGATARPLNTAPLGFAAIRQAAIHAAGEGLDFDGLSIRTDGDRFTVSTPSLTRENISLAALRRQLDLNQEFVTNWYHWRVRVGGPERPRYTFLRWLERADEWSVPPRYTALDTGISRQWGQLQVTTRLDVDGDRRYAVRHVDDSEAATTNLTTHRDLRAVRELVRHDDRGRYRPLAGAPDLPTGWRCGSLSGDEVVQLIEWIYPATIANWSRERRGRLDVSHWRETAARQTGMYELVSELDQSAIERATAACCTDGGCLKRRVWEFDADRELLVDAGDGVFPCREPCSFLIAAAREWAVLERAAEGSNESTVDHEQRDAIFQAIATGRIETVGLGEFEDPANRYRVRYYLAQQDVSASIDDAGSELE